MKNEEPLYNSVHKSCWQLSAMPRNITDNEASEKLVNICAESFGNAQTEYNGIIRCAITVSSFSMCNIYMLPHKSFGELQQEDDD